MTPPELHRKAAGELVGEQIVIDLRDHDDRVVQSPGVHRQPRPVRAVDLVGDDEVGVQVRVPRTGVPVVEPGRDQAIDLLLLAAVGSGSSERRGVLQEGQRMLDGGPVRGQNRRLGGLVGHRPQGRDRLRRGERQVEPCHRRRGSLGQLHAGDRGDRGVAGLASQVLR